MKAAKAKDEVFGEGEVDSGEVGDGDVGKSANLADGGCCDAEGGGAEGGVGVLIFVAVDALWHLVLVSGGSKQLLLVGVGKEFDELWWLVFLVVWCW